MLTWPALPPPASRAPDPGRSVRGMGERLGKLSTESLEDRVYNLQAEKAAQRSQGRQSSRAARCSRQVLLWSELEHFFFSFFLFFLWGGTGGGRW